MTATQLAIDIQPAAPIQSRPIIANQPETCPIRSWCLAAILEARSDYRCGFEQAGTVAGCPKRWDREVEK